MARGVLATQSTVRTGLVASYTAATVDGHGVDNADQKTVIHVKNGGGVAVVVTFPTVPTVDGLAIPDRTISIPAGEERYIGPFPKGIYNQDDTAGDTGIKECLFIDTDVQASVTYAAIKLGAK